MEAEEYDSSIDPEWVLTEEAANWYQDRIQKDNGLAVVAQNEEQIIGYAVAVSAPAEPYRKTDTTMPN